MVLKRLFLTALGALGLGALATGTAMAQSDGNIPAPRTFEGALDCGATSLMVAMPSVVPRGGMYSPLDYLLRGMTAMGDPQVIPTTVTNTAGDVTLGSKADLAAVVPVDADMLDCREIGPGYEAVLTEFNKVVRLEDLVERRQKTVDDATNPSDAQLRLLEQAQEDLAEAQADLDTVGMGPIYQAAIAEWRAKGAVEDAISGWDKAVGTYNTAETAFLETDGSANQYANYVQLNVTGNNAAAALASQFNAQGDPVATFSQAAIDAYAGTGNPNFDPAGDLVIPMEDDPDSTDPADMIIDVTAVDVEDIQTNLENAQDALAGLEKLARENSDASRQDAYDEAVRRASLEVSHYERQWDNLISDDTQITADDPNTPDVNEFKSLETAYSALQRSEIDRDGAEDELRTSVMAREDATKNVLNAFGNPGSFYDQLISQIQSNIAGYVDNNASARTIRNAREALATAQDELEKYNELVGDGSSPAAALLTELFKVDGDDGGALVDAISETYGAANSAKTTAESVAESVAGLTGEGGAVAKNTSDISALDGRVAKNEEDIASNTTMIGENRGMIVTNAENIATNTTMIGENRTMIGENRGMIATNAGNIMMNSEDIMTNTGRIDAAEGRISSNADAIAANMNSIGSNASAIGDNRNMIGELSDDLDVVRAGVAASMALAGMPAINGRGVSIGVGSFDGESAFAVGFQIQGEMASFKVGVTSASGATGASAGVGFQF